MTKPGEVRWIERADLSEGIADAWEADYRANTAVQYEGRWWMIMGIQTNFRVNGGMTQIFKLSETRKPN